MFLLNVAHSMTPYIRTYSDHTLDIRTVPCILVGGLIKGQRARVEQVSETLSCQDSSMSCPSCADMLQQVCNINCAGFQEYTWKESTVEST